MKSVESGRAYGGMHHLGMLLKGGTPAEQEDDRIDNEYRAMEIYVTAAEGSRLHLTGRRSPLTGVVYPPRWIARGLRFGIGNNR